MTMRSDFKRWRLRNLLLAVTAVVATAGPALSQSASDNVAKPYEGEYASWDIGGDFGTQWFQVFQGKVARSHELLARPVVGIRSTQNIGRYFGVEEGFGVAFNRLALLPAGGSVYATIAQRDYQLDILGLAYFTPRTARYRPYVGPWRAPVSDSTT